MSVLLVERDNEWKAIQEHYLQTEREGLSRLVLLTGPAGIGKTALLDAFADWAPRPEILRARASEFEAGTPYGLLRYGLGVLSHHTGDPELRGAALALAADLHETPGAPIPTEVNLHAQVRRLLSALGGAKLPAVLVLDDLHDADSDTVALIGRLLRSTIGPPVFILAASRPHGLSGSLSGPLAGLLTRSASEGRWVRAELHPLTLRGVSEVGRHELGCEPTHLLADYVLRATGGVPFHVTRLYRELSRRGQVSLGVRADLTPRSLAAFVDEASTMSGHLPSLTADQARVAQALAVLGRCRGSEMSMLLDLADVTEAQARLALLALIDVGLIVADREDWYEFTHPILRSIVYSQLPRVASAELHDRAACLFRNRPSGLRDPFSYAIHIDRGVGATKEQRRHAATAAAMAAMMTAPLAAEYWFGKAAETLPRGNPDRVRLLSLRAQSCLLGTDSTEGIRIGLQAIEEAGPGVYRDEMFFLTAFGLFFGGRVEEAVTLGTDELVNHPSNRAAEVAQLSLLYQLQLSTQAAAAFPAALEAAYSETDNQTVRAASIGQLYLYADLREMADERDRLLADFRVAIRRLPPMFAAEVYDALGLQIGSYSGALQQAAADVRLADQLRGRRHEMSAWGFSELAVATVTWLNGSWAETLEAIETAVWADEVGGNMLTAQMLRSIGVIVLTNRGERVRAIEMGSRLEADVPVMARGVSALARSRLAPTAEAIAILHGRLREQLTHEYWYLAGAIGAELFRRTADAPEARRAAVPMIEQVLDRTTSPLNRMWLMHALGVHRGDRAMLDEALNLAIAEGTRFEEARILLSLSRLTLDAEPALRAVNLFESLGAEPDHAAAARQCREFGRRVHVPRKSPAGLSEAERAVAMLVVTGLSNRQVADELSYSVKRIEALLSAAYRKLGLRNRYELIALYKTNPGGFERTDRT